jgi:hypothetical protein
MVVLGLICNNDESDYRNAVEYVNTWCNRNYLDLNVSKTKEVVYDTRKNKCDPVPIIIKEDTVDIVNNFKYLGITLQDDLKWSVHTAAQVKKGNKRLYHVRCLQKLNVDPKIMCMFYNCVISSVLVYALVCWYGSCSKQNKSAILKVRKRCKRIVGKHWEDTLDHQKESIPSDA